MKICSKCRNPREEKEFSSRLKSPDGLGAYCKSCAKESYKEYSRSHRKILSERSRDWRELHPGYYFGRDRREYKKNRYLTDPSYRVECSLRGRLRHALRTIGGTKSAPTFELLGCPKVWLEVHLESLFRPGMSWENYGPIWEIDHIRPCSNYDLRKFEHQKACFHWTNLQPLFTGENRRKSNKYD